jgi:hypothetical protein
MDQDSALFKQDSGRWGETVVRAVELSGGRGCCGRVFARTAVFGVGELTSARVRRCAPRLDLFGEGTKGWKCSGGRNRFDQSSNPTATSALSARLSVTSASRTNSFQVAIRTGGGRVAEKGGEDVWSTHRLFIERLIEVPDPL